MVFDLVHFKNKILPKIVYFTVHASFVIPTIVLNSDYLTKTTEGQVFLSIFIVVSLLTYGSYLRVALADPGYINSLMFNKAYANNETDVSMDNTPSHS